MPINYDLKRYKCITIGTGITTMVGVMFHEYYRIKRTLNSIVNINVLDIDKKRPDYIYIKYQIYRESMEKLKNDKQSKHWIDIIIYPFNKWWKSVKHSVAWHLLEIAKTGNQHDRIKAVRQLSLIDHLKDWDYQHLAQICDERTAISLARHSCDTRWFLPPYAYGCERSPKSIIYELREHFTRLHHLKCIKYFYKTTLNDFAILKGYTNEEQYNNNNRNSECTKQELDCLKQCIELLFHLTRNPSTSRLLIENGLLKPLMELQKIIRNNLEMSFLLSKVIANMSVCNDKGYDFFVTGWVGVLAKWIRNADMRVQVIAAKALSNLDIDDLFHNEYSPYVYPLYPKARIRQKPNLDIVFIHGLLGGVFITWRQKDRDESELGLYGKNAFYTKESDNVFLLEEPIKTINKNNNKELNVNNSNNNINNIESPVNNIIINESDQNESLIYDESPLITKQAHKKKSPISDIATKEFLEALETATELNDEWEIVFPDCPQTAYDNSNGPFSVSGGEWMNEDRHEEYTYCWPMDWLPFDYPNIRVIGLNYETSLTEWAASNSSGCPCEKKNSLHDRSEDFLKSLVAAGVGSKNRPIIWVGHSMGGLVAKSIIVQSLQSTDPNVRAIGEQTAGILFLGTPHKGSSVAKLKRHVQLLLSPSLEVQELCENSSLLLQLHDQFLNALKTYRKHVNIVSIAEGYPTVLTVFKFPFHIVTEQSANLQIGDFYVLKSDHLGLSKPIVRQSFLYQRLLRIIEDVLVVNERKSSSNVVNSNNNNSNNNNSNNDENINDIDKNDQIEDLVDDDRFLTRIWLAILNVF